MEHIVISPAGAPLSASSAYLVPDTRPAIEMAVESFLARLDELDGDPDLEPNGDDEAVIANGDTLDHSWPEWHDRGRHKMTSAGYEMAPPTYSEDDEDSDEDGQCCEDEISTNLSVLTRNSGPGCPIADPDKSCDDDGVDGQEGY
ncbi:MAG: hypothetical protein ABIT09_06625 [Croceibacterium sp.]